MCHPTFIDDAVSGMLLALAKGSSATFTHLTGPEPVTFRELAETIAAELGVKPPWLNMPKVVALAKVGGRSGDDGQGNGKRPLLSRTGVAFFSEDRCFSGAKRRQNWVMPQRLIYRQGWRKRWPGIGRMDCCHDEDLRYQIIIWPGAGGRGRCGHGV
ncbi:MAG: hypothetical protein M5U34_43905 [Chloroflexi bacterium]|nr:hypothetical protein [Chloroflexota bacterium]